MPDSLLPGCVYEPTDVPWEKPDTLPQRPRLHRLVLQRARRPELPVQWHASGTVVQSWFGYSLTAAPRNTPRICKSHHHIITATTKLPRWEVSRSVPILGGSADKSLAQPTSRCRRTESIVSLERGVCSCAEMQGFSCYRGSKEACQATRSSSTTWRRELSSRFFFLQGNAPKEIHAILTNTWGTCTIVCHRQKLGGPV